MTFQTERCLIRPFTLADIDAFMAYRNDPQWMRFQGFKGLTREAYVQALLAPIDQTAGFQLAIIHLADHMLIGDLYLKQEGDACLIGYTVSPAYARQHYAAEAVQGALHWASGQGFRQMVAWVEPENVASIGLLQRLGFSPIEANEDGELGFVYPLPFPGVSG